MKKIVSISLLSAIALYATNGDNLIGFSAKSRALGGVGIATSLGANSAMANPALISKVKRKEFNFGITYFTPVINTNGTKSKSDQNFIPYFSYAEDITSNFYYGLSLYGSSGMGVDFKNSGNPSLLSAQSNMVIMKIAPVIAYKKGPLSIGFSPIIQYGSLKLHYNSGISKTLGTSEDLGLGAKIGVAYSVTPSLNIGATYQSSISMSYKNVLSAASSDFGLSIGDTLEQPAELGLGLAYDISNFTIAADYKKVQWGNAKGYKEFGWTNQNVYALGIKYEKNGTWYGVGYNHAKTPIRKDFGGAFSTVINTLNYIFFPATQEDHYTIGAGTKITKSLSLDTSFAYGAKNIINAIGVTGPIKVKHSEQTISVGFKYSF